MVYVRSALLLTVLFLFALGGYIFFAFDARYELKIAEEQYLKGNIDEAMATVERLKDSLKPVEYHLFMGYFFREQKQLKNSTEQFSLAFANLPLKGNQRERLEVIFNQAMNGYLLGDMEELERTVVYARDVAKRDDGWLKVFSGLSEFIQKDYQQALVQWRQRGTLQPLSPWMAKSFGSIFNEFWFTAHIARCQIEEGAFLVARQSLEQVVVPLSVTQQHKVDFLLGLSYIKEAQEKLVGLSLPYYKLGFSYFDRMPILHERYQGERKRILEQIKEEIAVLVDEGSFEGLSFYVQLFERWNEPMLLQEFSDSLFVLASQALKQEAWDDLERVTLALNRLLPPGEIRENFEATLREGLLQAIALLDIQHVNRYWHVVAAFNQNLQTVKEMAASAAEEAILANIEGDNDSIVNTREMLAFWDNVQKNEGERIRFAEHMTEQAAQLWMDARQPKKAVKVMVLASGLLSGERQGAFQVVLERHLDAIYKNVAQNNYIDDLTVISQGVELLELQNFHERNKQLREEQLELATHLIDKGEYKAAGQKTLWVLQIYPEDVSANRLIGLVEYYQGNYAKALDTLLPLESKSDEEVQRALGVSFFVLGQEKEGNQRVQPLLEKGELPRTVILDISFAFLLGGKGEQGLSWLSKVDLSDTEATVGRLYAYTLLSRWGDVLAQYDRLPERYQSDLALSQFALQAYINQQMSQEVENKVKMLLANHGEVHSLKGSAPFQRFYLSAFGSVNPYDLAASYYLNSLKQPEVALALLKRIDKPTQPQILQKAEVLLVLGHDDEARHLVVSLEKEGVKKSYWVNFQGVLGTLEAKSGFFMEALAPFELYLEKRPDDKEKRREYAKVLMALQKFSEAIKQYDFLKEEEEYSKKDYVEVIACLVHLDRFDLANQRVRSWWEEGELNLDTSLKIAQLMVVTKESAFVDAVIGDAKRVPNLTTGQVNALFALYLTQANYDAAHVLLSREGEKMRRSEDGVLLLSEYDSLIGKNKNQKTNTFGEIDSQIVNSDTLTLVEAKRLLGLADNESIKRSQSLVMGIIEKYPNLPVPYYLLARGEAALKMPEEAERAFCQAVELDPSYSEAYYFLGQLYQDMGKRDQAEEMIRLSIRFEPSSAMAWSKLAEVNMAQGNTFDAITALQNEIRILPNGVQGYVALGRLYLEINNPEDAMMALERALVLSPENTEALKLLLRVVEDSALTLEYDGRTLEERKAELQQKLGRFD